MTLGLQLARSSDAGLSLHQASVASMPSMVQVKVLFAGICGSDLKILAQGNERVPDGRIMGHEGIGEVVFVPESLDVDLQVGDLVAMGSDFPCLVCKFCRSSSGEFCGTDNALGHEIDGLFATHVNLPKDFVEMGPIVKLTSDFLLQAFVLAEPLACVIRGVNAMFQRRRHLPGDSALVSGAGTIGLLAAIYMKSKGIADVLIEDPDSERLLTASKQRGFEMKFANSSAKAGETFDYIFLANSDDVSHRRAHERLSKFGVLNFFGGVPKPSKSLTLSSRDIHYGNLTILGTHGSGRSDFLEAVAFIDSHREALAQLVGPFYTLQDFRTAIEAAQSRKHFKIAFRMD